MTFTEFTPLASLIGGTLIGLSAVMLMAFAGRIAGVSGILVRIFPPHSDHEFAGRFAFVAGLIAAPLLVMLASGQWPPQVIETGAFGLALAGLLVGFGSIWGNGCTSGHGVCGLSRLSIRSMVATASFMTTAIITVFLMRHVL